MASLVLVIKSAEADDLKGSTAIESIQDINNHLTALAAGMAKGVVYAQSSADNPVAASATATLVSCATDTITVGKTVFTGTGTPTTSLHFETDGNDAADAAALAAAINAHPDTSKIVKATVASNVVTITALHRGIIGNHIALSRTGTTITLTGSGFLASGTGGAANEASTYNFGG